MGIIVIEKGENKMFKSTITQVKSSAGQHLESLIPLILLFSIKKITKKEFENMVEILLKKLKTPNTIQQETINVLTDKFNKDK